ncbi:MAG: hypothetical protein LIO56_04755 [Lachnospiraceae bacterium]|nr:hypothetical protein [Lachnospiraceae bacterium]
MKKFLLKLTYSILYIFVVVDCLVVLDLLFKWNDLTFLAKLAHFWILALTVHQMEESRFPGGFVWNYNILQDPEGTNPLAYPMNRLSWFVVDCAATVIFTLCALVWYRPFVNLLFMFSGLLNLVLISAQEWVITKSSKIRGVKESIIRDLHQSGFCGRRCPL